MKEYSPDNENIEEILDNRVELEDLTEREGENVAITGYVDNKRKLGDSLKFFEIQDGSNRTQLTLKEGFFEGVDKIDDVSDHTFVAATGKVVDGQWDEGMEIEVEDIYKLGEEADELPISTGSERSGLNKRLDYRWADLRNEESRLPLEVVSSFVGNSREFFEEEGLNEIFSPKLMSSASESGSELFSVDYFGEEAHLAQSPQFYKQMGVVSGFDGVYEVAPVFRANPSNTSRHDSEFTSLDVEIPYISGVEDVMAFEEDMINYVFENIDQELGGEIEDTFEVEINPPENIPRMDIKEVYEIVGEENVAENGDLTTPGEKVLGEHLMNEEDEEFVFVKNYPQEARPFYHMQKELDDGRETTRSYDLIFKGLEVTTGAQREHRYNKIIDQAQEDGIHPDQLGSYTDFFKYGAPPHGGFGLSPTRVVQSMLNLDNVREATYLPRNAQRLEP